MTSRDDQNPTSLMGRLNRLGISNGAATKWAEYTGSNWTTYAAIRTKPIAQGDQDTPGPS